jgi:predicted Zn-ribbon and HTH transcriptional regulator
MFKILRNNKLDKVIAVDTKTGEVFEEIEEQIKEEIPEKKKRKKKKHYKNIAKKEKSKPEKIGKRWSRNYDKCKQCGTDEVKHAGNGLCKNCYQGGLRGGKGKSKWSKKTYQKKDDMQQPPISSAANSFMCRDCGHTFQSVMEEDEVLCPNCESEHCEIVK